VTIAITKRILERQNDKGQHHFDMLFTSLHFIYDKNTSNLILSFLLLDTRQTG